MDSDGKEGKSLSLLRWAREALKAVWEITSHDLWISWTRSASGNGRECIHENPIFTPLPRPLLFWDCEWSLHFGSGAEFMVLGNGRNTVSGVLFRRRELTEPHWVLRKTQWVLRKTRWVRFGTQIIGWEELTELAPRNSMSPEKLTEFGVWNRTPRNRIRPVSKVRIPATPWFTRFLFWDQLLPLKTVERSTASKFHFARLMPSNPPKTQASLPHSVTTLFGLAWSSPGLARSSPGLARSSPDPRPILIFLQHFGSSMSNRTKAKSTRYSRVALGVETTARLLPVRYPRL